MVSGLNTGVIYNVPIGFKQTLELSIVYTLLHFTVFWWVKIFIKQP